MADRKTNSPSKASGSPSKSSQSQSNEHTQASQRSQSDSAAATMTRSFSASHAVSSNTKERRPSKESIESGTFDDEYSNHETYQDEEEKPQKPGISKRHSSSSHTNVYTECGRHGDDWLFGGLSDVVKSVFKKGDKN